jgi:putative intracellular protease/amidase
VTLCERKVAFDHHHTGGRGVEMNVRSAPAFRRFLRSAVDILGVVVVVCIVAWVMLWAAFTL